jgi:bacterioferritin-associated ferredoxin
MYVCLCHRVTDRQIRNLARAGVSTIEELQEQTCLGQGCGCCLLEAEEILGEHQPVRSRASIFPGAGSSLKPAV